MMTREQVEAILAKLTRWELTGDGEGDHGMVPVENGEAGEFVTFDDVREALEALIPRSIGAQWDARTGETSVVYAVNQFEWLPGASVVDIRNQHHEAARLAGQPIQTGAGGGGGGKSFSEWMFPDGHMETLPINAKPVWPKVGAPREAGQEAG
jgi:hypothetical protein